MNDPLEEPLATGPLRGASATKLTKHLGLHTVGDLLGHYPRRYEQWGGQLTPLAELPQGESVTILAEVVSVKAIAMKQRRGTMLKVKVTDGTDQLELTFFNAHKLARVLHPGKRGLFAGTVGRFNNVPQLTHPKMLFFDAPGEDDALAALDRPMPIYPTVAGLDSQVIRTSAGVVLDVLGEVPDPVPAELLARHRLLSLTEALHQVHRPHDDQQWRQAQRRLRFDEAFVLQVALALRRAADAALPATPRRSRPGGLLEAFDGRLPFELTQGQRTVGREIADDLDRSSPMHRLLHGDVGSGKTVVALRAMLTTVDGGAQAALLAPTEVLAAQHHRSVTQMLGDLAQGGMLGGSEFGTQVALLTGSQPTSARRAALLAAACGDAGIVIGTHALLQENVSFFDLGLVVVDEQHRFGVEQRDALRGKGSNATPHLLVMTATPIPRTVAMTVFGDLEVSTLTEVPAGRGAISTHVVALAEHPAWYERSWRRVREEVAAGHQVYVVCPRIGDETTDEPRNETTDEPDDETRRPVRGVLEVLAELRADPVLDGVRIEVLHGRLPADQRDATMRDFAAGKVDVLVATTVIEVGVDVANATAMVVLDADRFGVSQLHQLRGRVGRGTAAGLCLLVTQAEPGSPARSRLDAVAGTLDGFELARVDLEQRREGDVLGAAQSGGRTSLRFLRVLRDEKLIEQARQEATALVADDPDLTAHPALRRAMDQLLDPEREAYLERG